MSSRKRSRRTKVEEEVEEVGVEVPSQGGGTQEDGEWGSHIEHIKQLTQTHNEELEDIEQAQSLQNITQEERDVLVAEMVRHVVFKNHSKNGVPISHSELSDIVNRKNTGNARKGATRLMIKLTQAKLLEIFGLELREIQRVSQAAKGSGRSKGPAQERSTVWYVLRSTLPESLRLNLVQAPMKKEVFNALAMMVLTCLYLKGDEGLMEDELWRLLKLGTGIDEKTELPNDETAGAQLKRMEAMRYIVKEKAAAPDEGFKYRMAENALNEVGGAEGIGQFLSQFTDGDNED